MSRAYPELPSTQALLCFESTARWGSITQAGRELGLSQSAVSRQLATLEQLVGVGLLKREGRGIALTPAGESYLPEVRAALVTLAAAAEGLRAPSEARRVSLQAHSTFAVRWLVPRLQAFEAAHPEVMLRILTSDMQQNLHREALDAVVSAGIGPWPKMRVTTLFPERLVPLFSSSLAARFPGLWQGDLRHAPRVDTLTRAELWHHYEEQHALSFARAPEHQFKHFYLSIEAALAGLGVALAPLHYVLDALSTGALHTCAPGGARMVLSGRRFVLLEAQDTPSTAAMRTLHAWLVDEAHACEARVAYWLTQAA